MAFGWNTGAQYATIISRLTEIQTNIVTLSKRISKMDAAILALKDSVDAYVAAVDAMIEAHKVAVTDAVNAAIEADDAAEAVDLGALKETVDAALAKLVPPDAPVFEPSNVIE